MAGICTRECALDMEPMDQCHEVFNIVTERLERAVGVKNPYGLAIWLVRDEFAKVRERFSETKRKEPKLRTDAFGQPIKTENPFQAFIDQL
jgi:hypothetical protein